MKKLLNSAIILVVFSIAITLFQISCSKIALANDDDDSNKKDKAILYLKTHFDGSGVDLWSINIDGSNDHKINIILPGNYRFAGNSNTARITGDGKKIIFTGYREFLNSEGVPINQNYAFFSCNINGSNVVKLKDISDRDNVELQDLY